MITSEKIQELVEHLDIASHESQPYLNRKTGQIESRFEDYFSNSIENLEDLPEWMAEAVKITREIDESDDWVELPSKFDVHEWSIMQDFARSIQDNELSELLMDSIHRKGAFRAFRDAIYRHGIQDNWYAFKKTALREVIESWLERNKIPFERTHDSD